MVPTCRKSSLSLLAGSARELCSACLWLVDDLLSPGLSSCVPPSLRKGSLFRRQMAGVCCRLIPGPERRGSPLLIEGLPTADLPRGCPRFISDEAKFYFLWGGIKQVKHDYNRAYLCRQLRAKWRAARLALKLNLSAGRFQESIIEMAFCINKTYCRETLTAKVAITGHKASPAKPVRPGRNDGSMQSTSGATVLEKGLRYTRP